MYLRLRVYAPNSSPSAASSRPEPITHSLPVTSGPQARTSCSPGTMSNSNQPSPAVHDALGAQDGAVFAAVQRGQRLLQRFAAVLVRGLAPPAREHLVGVVVVVMVAAAAHAVLVVVVHMALVFLVVMAAVLMLMVMVVMAVLVVVLAVVVVVAAVAVVVVMVVFVLVLPGVGGVGGPGLADQLGDQVALAVHDRDDLLAGQAGPVGRDDGGGGVFSPAAA